MKTLQMKRGKGTCLDQTEHLSLTNSLRSLVANELLPFGWACAAPTVAALAAGLTSVAAPLVCAWVVAIADTLSLGLLGIDLSLLGDGGAVAGPPVVDDSSGFSSSSGAELLG